MLQMSVPKCSCHAQILVKCSACKGIRSVAKAKQNNIPWNQQGKRRGGKYVNQAKNQGSWVYKEGSIFK